MGLYGLTATYIYRERGSSGGGGGIFETERMPLSENKPNSTGLIFGMLDTVRPASFLYHCTHTRSLLCTTAALAAAFLRVWTRVQVMCPEGIPITHYLTGVTSTCASGREFPV